MMTDNPAEDDEQLLDSDDSDEAASEAGFTEGHDDSNDTP